ncbi:hypothetical protein FRACYDRAFT_245874 [Fragilariopsis cylindrus CCMP1102]|uniref:Uncharacterized protein n=1 Tax=Fragilariopsis cylindrus CCMP1102 TaxID=635003 RepID=A0A1E7F0R4_9STRA|nr:hypothetical protein FRACYDRAFT_245874 [Fragilariopsis cylindrus CCMP1102]|eukprot:OEU11393.1 hypothetical protein FRACYDRAFT_245874 [Fragilariopsis cylindrus CCMP1102]
MVMLHDDERVENFQNQFYSLISCRLDRFKGSPRFVKFGERLADTVEDQWETVLAATALIQERTQVSSCISMNSISDMFQEDAKDVMIEYMATEECIKSRNVATLDHCNRLPGIEPNIGDNKSKQLIIFRSMPDKYKRSYLESGHVVADETLVSIVRYMEQQENVDA